MSAFNSCTQHLKQQNHKQYVTELLLYCNICQHENEKRANCYRKGKGKRDKQRKQKERKSQSKKRFYQPQRLSFPFNIKQKITLLSIILLNTHTHTHTWTHTAKYCRHADTDTHVPPSRHDMSPCPLEIPGDINPTPASEPISRYTRRPAHREHTVCKLTDTPSLSFSLSLALSFSHHKHSPFPFISSLFISLPCFLLNLSAFSTFKNMHGHAGHIVV